MCSCQDIRFKDVVHRIGEPRTITYIAHRGRKKDIPRLGSIEQPIPYAISPTSNLASSATTTSTTTTSSSSSPSATASSSSSTASSSTRESTTSSTAGSKSSSAAAAATTETSQPCGTSRRG